MIEDDETVREMRNRVLSEKSLPRSFMAASELKTLRLTVLRVSQSRLAEQLLKPSTGLPVLKATLSAWERGNRAVPLWAARRIRELSEAARRYDAKGGA